MKKEDPELSEKEGFLTCSFQRMGIILTARQTQQLLSYYNLLIEKNRVMNLTAITEFDEVVQKHFLDSILVSNIIDINDFSSLIDVGSGAGFPGIPLKILYPSVKMTLLDSRNKRVQFLNEVIEQLNLKGISAIHARAETAAREMAYREQYTLCVSRAVAQLNILSEYCLPFVRPGGLFAAYKSAEIRKECEEAESAIRILGGSILSTEILTIPGSKIQRSFVLVRKEKKTARRYPRRAGLPEKSPLV